MTDAQLTEKINLFRGVELHEMTDFSKNGKPLVKESHERRRRNKSVVMKPLPKELDEGRQKLFEDIGTEFESWCQHNDRMLMVEKSREAKAKVKASDAALIDMRCDRFKNSHNYKKVMNTRVFLEKEYDRKVTKCRIIKGINISEWKQEKDEMGYVIWTAVFELSKIDMKISLCEKVKLSIMVREGNTMKKVSEEGKIFKIPDRESTMIEVELEEPCEELTQQWKGFEMTFLFDPTPSDRMICGISEFGDIPTELIGDRTGDRITSLFIASQRKRMILGLDFTPVLLDSPRIAVPSIEGLPDLNQAQKEAVMHVLKNPLTLIQGPPGTGKTVTSAHIVHHLRQSTGSTVLVCAQSNIAVDNLMKVILKKKGINVVRINSQVKEREKDNPFWYLSLDYLIGKRCPKLKNFYRQIKFMDKQDLDDMFRLKRKIEQQIMNKADVVCCTSSGAGDHRVKRHKFLSCLVDECGQGNEADTLIPISRTYGRVVLVGDHKQLGPVIHCEDAKKAGMELSMFDRLIKIGIPIRMFNKQYRMHPAISQFPNKTFYDGKLVDGVKASKRICNGFPWPRNNHPVMFYACNNGKEKRYGTSFLNMKEAKMVKKFLVHLMSNGVQGKNIGIICGYDSQKQWLISQMKIPVSVEINTVDGFQGREKEIIIMTCVRSESVGFLKDPRRMNVSLTRAKSGLIIIGNAICLKTDSLWEKLLNHMQERKVLVGGSLNKWLPIDLNNLADGKVHGHVKIRQIRRRNRVQEREVF